MTGDTLAVKSALGTRRERAGGDWPIYPASLTLEVADGRFVAVSAPGPNDLAAAVERLGRRRPADLERARGELADLVGALPAPEAVRALRQAGLCASPVNSVADLVKEAHLWSRGDLIRLPDPEHGEIVTQGVVPSLSMTPGRVTGWSRQPGSDNGPVLGGLIGYGPEQIRRLTTPTRGAAPPPAQRSAISSGSVGGAGSGSRANQD
jgi:crotonobetainyl-CoA:carnitine CoA-transferase CaiB-like acyl-CoA transferase